MLDVCCQKVLVTDYFLFYCPTGGPSGNPYGSDPCFLIVPGTAIILSSFVGWSFLILSFLLWLMNEFLTGRLETSAEQISAV